MAKFVCTRCNYHFESAVEQTGKRCPYCGEKSLIREPDAEELLKEL